MNLTASNITLTFTVYGPPGPLSYVLSTLLFLIYLFSISANMFLALIIYLESSLHKPMYVFLFNLAVNGVIGSSSVCPKIMVHLLSGVQGSSYNGCLIQVFFVNFYGTSAYVILAVMAYDRYVSICKPLLYHAIMTPAKVKQLLLITYFFPIFSLSAQVYLTSRLPLCRHTITKLFCDNLAIVNLSCVKSNLDNIFGIFIVLSLAVLPLICVVISYIQILKVSWKTSRDAQQKALSTCTPHLVVFINFSLATLFSVIYNRANMYISSEVNIFMSLHFILIPPVLHPVIYGIRTKEIRRSIMKILRRRNLFTVLVDTVEVKSTFAC